MSHPPQPYTEVPICPSLCPSNALRSHAVIFPTPLRPGTEAEPAERALFIVETVKARYSQNFKFQR